MRSPKSRQVVWVGSSRSDLLKCSGAVRQEVGFALYQAQDGRLHVGAKVMKGFGGASVVEIVANDCGGTYGTVYTVRFAGAIYVLHMFQKKSTSGIQTAKRDIRLIQQRLAEASAHYEVHRHEFI